MNKITIVIIEDHKMVREMWGKLLSERKDILISGKFADFYEALETIKTKQPEIILLDINLAGTTGIDAVPRILSFAPATRIIAVTMHNQIAYVRKMIKMGARGYVTKNSLPDEILTAVDEVMADKVYICKEIKDMISEKLYDDKPIENPLKDLSLREIEIIKLVKEGLSSKEIAEQLGISTRTANVHRYNILKKLGFKNSTSLINFISTTDIYY